MRLHAIPSWYTEGGLVTLEDDVLSIVSQVREIYGDRIYIEMDPRHGTYHFVENCADGAQRLIFSTAVLDPRALDRLRRADSHWHGYEDPYDAAERAQDEAHALADAKFGEMIQEVGEEMAFALRREGRAPRFPLPVAIPKEVKDA